MCYIPVVDSGKTAGKMESFRFFLLPFDLIWFE